jgi:predicted permease
MPDWIAFVRRHLDLSNLTATREAEIVEEVGRQLDDVYQDALARGCTEDAAARAARNHVADWTSFANDLYRTNRHHLRTRVAGWTDRAEARAHAPAARESLLRRALSGLALDLVQTARELARQPGFASIVIVTLGLGIGANTAIFSLLDQVLLRSLPVERPQELVLLHYSGPNTGRVIGDGARAFSYPMYRDLRDASQGAADLIAWFQTPVNLADGARAARVQAELVSGNYFSVLGLRPAAGRLLTPDDDGAGGGRPAVVLSHALWRQRFGGDREVVGRTIRLNNRPMTVVGVAPANFASTEVGAPPDVYVPVGAKAAMTPTWDELENRRSQWLSIMGRLRPGVTRERAEAALRVTFRQARAEEVKAITRFTEARRKRFVESSLSLSPGWRGVSALREQFSTALVLLMGMVGLVLLIACVNVANLFMARAPARQREVAVRLALGAGAGRIVRRLLVESLLLAAAGGAAGLLLSSWTTGLLLGVLPGAGARAFSPSPDARVLGFAALASALTALVVGLVPALQASRPHMVEALKEDGGRVVSAGHAVLRRALVVAQVALSLLLLVGAGLFARTLLNLRSLDPGFDTARVVTFSVDPTLSGYDTERTLAFYQRLEERLRQAPGVMSAALASVPPLTDSFMISTIKVEGYEPRDGENMNPHVNNVGPGYFRTLGTRFVSGRDFTDADGAGSRPVAIISETMARAYFGTTDPVGRRIGFRQSTPPDTEIVGVVKDTKDNMLRDDVTRVVYTPYPQDSELSQMTAFVRLAPGVPVDRVRQIAERVDPAVPPFDVKSMDAQKSESLFVDRMVASLSIAFGGLATLLAAIGIYGVMSHAVARRTREIGLRMALGAPPTRVVGLVMREVAALAVAGTLVGLPAALGASRFVESQLFGLSPADPLTLAGAVVALLGVALAAGYVPASQAARVDPLRALRQG